ncbi:MAG: 3-oxoacyl-ACP reductase FabG [Chloroflexi bacterium]|nr:3-oxoacyl-ACP reductase FabG [Chloroflexota bacterium]
MAALDGQVALVTGASRGIGRAIALELASHGATLAVNYRTNAEAARGVVAEIEAAGGTAGAYQADISDLDQCKAMVASIVGDLGAIRVLVNNAGTTADRTIARMTPEEWHTVIDTNVNGLYNVTSPVWPVMGEAGGGHVVCIASIVGETGRLGLVNYGTSKEAAIGFVRGLAREGARFGIHVNAVAPGFVDTDMISGLNEQQRENLTGEILLGRLGKPEEIASLVRYIVTEGTYITGSVFNVNGGMFVH